MSQRLENLKRQKQLIEEHLRWIDAEIVAETGVSWQSEQPDAPQKAASIAPFPATPIKEEPKPEVQVPVAAAMEKEPEESIDDLSDQLISQYGHVSARREMDPRLSLVLFFGGLLGFIGLVIFIFYWFGYR